MDNAIPEEMRRNGRPIDPDFHPTESLYIRLPGKNRKKADIADIRLPIQSANRSKYGKPEWVLLPSYVDDSVGAVEVEHVRIEGTSKGSVHYELRVEHVPEENNYAHSEIRTYKKGVQLGNNEKNKINYGLRQELRRRIAEKITVVLPAP